MARPQPQPVMSNLLQKQIEYYRARAPEYDDWFYRRDRYDQGEAHTRQWRREIRQVRDQLHRVTDLGHILELAPGTGIWTAELIQIGERVSALDASPEMIAINRAKLGSERVDYQLVDLFRYQPARQYDMVFFGFWLSHVPADKLPRFLETVHDALKPGGRLFLVDSRALDLAKNRTGTANLGADLQRRALKDGRQFDIVKVYYEPAELTETLREHGFDIEVEETENFFIYADGRKRA
ncbi:MAG: methyltransferase domain-containing protein [Chloroflexi bacterium]|nr:methyltransferase domain-containing protein [Chloroflexota bacterium]